MFNRILQIVRHPYPWIATVAGTINQWPRFKLTDVPNPDGGYPPASPVARAFCRVWCPLTARVADWAATRIVYANE